MKNDIVLNGEMNTENFFDPEVISTMGNQPLVNDLPEILIVTSYPPRECGIATYSLDLLEALTNKFSHSFSLKVCALESADANHTYPKEVKYVLNTSDLSGYAALAQTINQDDHIQIVLIQHEFGFFRQAGEDAFMQLLYGLSKPVIVAFHTVLPQPNKSLKVNVRRIVAASAAIIVMTKNAAKILRDDYGVAPEKLVVIAHGTHLVSHVSKVFLKEKYGLTGRKVLSTFGLLNSGKSIETTLDSLPAIIDLHPDVTFLVIGKTHPGVVLSEGEHYRDILEAKVEALSLRQHVKFINAYLPLQDLLEYLQMTDIYLFTSKDPHQAVSGTFSYAMSCGCPIISTPIPHAREVLRQDTGILIDFENSQQLTDGVNRLMNDELLRKQFSASTLHRIVPSAWENSAIAHAYLLQKIAGKTQQTEKITLQYRLPPINLAHIRKMTTEVGMIQFSKINQPDLESGYTLDDNARALIATCMHYEMTDDKADLPYMRTYLDFIAYCQQPAGGFLNYVDQEQSFTAQNDATNLSDANGRAFWALGYLISKGAFLPLDLLTTAEGVMMRALPVIDKMHSTRSMAFIIKGLYYANLELRSVEITTHIKTLANRLVQMYRHESERHWQWFESYLTYANSILPEALLCAWQETGDLIYKEIAKASFDFLLSLTFDECGIKVISNNGWLQKGQAAANYGEQPIDVAYTILALRRFHQVFKTDSYSHKMVDAFNWFLGNNHLHQIIYNPCTGGCYDGLEETHVNLNQGAESTLSYLMSRIALSASIPTSTSFATYTADAQTCLT